MKRRLPYWRSGLASQVTVGSAPPRYPVISSVVDTASGREVTITATSDILAAWGVEYGPTVAYDTSYGLPDIYTVSGEITIYSPPLVGGTCHYRMWATSVGGQTTYSADGTFVIQAAIGLAGSSDFLLMETGDYLLMEVGETADTDITGMTDGTTITAAQKFVINRAGVTMYVLGSAVKTFVNA